MASTTQKCDFEDMIRRMGWTTHEQGFRYRRSHVTIYTSPGGEWSSPSKSDVLRYIGRKERLEAKLDFVMGAPLMSPLIAN